MKYFSPKKTAFWLTIALILIVAGSVLIDSGTIVTGASVIGLGVFFLILAPIISDFVRIEQ